MKISIILPTYNRPSSLDITLQSISNQKISKEKFEVIVVDNNKYKDETHSIVLKKKINLNNLRYIHHPKPGLHEARHRGLKEAKYEWLVFLDDDVELLPNYLTGVQEAINNKDVVLIGGKNTPNYENTPPKWLNDLWEKEKWIGPLSILDLGDKQKYTSPLNVFGCNFVIKKSVLLQAGGFHPDSMPKEMLRYRGDGETYVSEYIKANGLKTYYHPDVSVKHWVPKERMTFEYWYQRAYRQGVSISYSQIREKGVSSIQKSHKISITDRIKKGIRDNYMMNVVSDQKKIKYLQQKGIQDGFRFHQDEVYNDKSLQEWVLKDSYL